MRRITGVAALTAAAGLTLSLPVAAQQQSSATQAEEEIVVTATRIETDIERLPAAVSVVNKDAIQLGRQQLALDESLNRVPGLFMQNRYDFTQDLRIAIRGFGSRGAFNVRGIKILVDGVPETMPDGFATVDTIDLGITDRIEVLRGPSSTHYGNASGGVINIISEEPPADSYAEVRVSAGDFGFQKIQAKTAGRTDRVGYLLSVMDSTLDGYRSHSAADSRLLTSRFNIDLGSDRELTAALSYSDEPWSEDPGGIDLAQAMADPRSARDANVQYDSGESAQQRRVSFVYRAPVGTKGEIQARNYYLWRDFIGKLPFVSGGQVGYDRFVSGLGVSYSHKSEVGGLPNQLLFGLDYDDQDDDRVRYDNLNGTAGPLVFNQNEVVTSRGYYVQDVLSLSNDIDLTMGLRYDEIEFQVQDHYLVDGNNSGSRKLDDTSPMLGISVQLSDHLAVYGTYSTSFETPTTTEYANPDGGGGFNQNLQPQTAENLEVGLRGQLGMHNGFELSVYDINVDDELIQYELAAYPDRDFFRNAAKSTRRGVEFSLKSQPTERISTQLSVTAASYKFDRFMTIDSLGNPAADYSGNRIPGLAEDTVFAEIAYKHPRGWFGIFDVLRTGNQYTTNDNSVSVPGYTVANLRFGWEQDTGPMKLSPFVGINNLFNESYNTNIRINPSFGARYYEPAPDRNIYVGATMDFGLD